MTYSSAYAGPGVRGQQDLLRRQFFHSSPWLWLKGTLGGLFLETYDHPLAPS